MKFWYSESHRREMDQGIGAAGVYHPPCFALLNDGRVVEYTTAYSGDDPAYRDCHGDAVYLGTGVFCGHTRPSGST